MSPEQLVFLVAKAVFERDQDSSKDKETSEACFFVFLIFVVSVSFPCCRNCSMYDEHQLKPYVPEGALDDLLKSPILKNPQYSSTGSTI